MNDYRKNENNFLICEECGRLCKNLKSLGCHIIKFHKIKPQIYYDKWIKEDNENICKKCEKPTAFMNLGLRYMQFCSKKCSRNSFETQEKERITNFKRYGVEYCWQNKIIRNKVQIASEKTCMIKYGVKNPTQNNNIFQKQQINSYCSKKYRNTNINYRALYEFDFLENFYNIFLDVQNSPSVKYKFQGKNKVYFPDFYIPSLNLVIEIKNSYLVEKDKEQIEAKEKATIANGFKYIMIVNKNYNEFNKLVNIH